MAENRITNPDHPDHPLHGLANERKARENREIKARERCAVCRNYWHACECSTGSQIAQLLAPGLRRCAECKTPIARCWQGGGGERCCPDCSHPGADNDASTEADTDGHIGRSADQ